MDSEAENREVYGVNQPSGPCSDDPIADLEPRLILWPLLGTLASKHGIWTISDLATFDINIAALIRGVGRTKLDLLKDLQEKAQRICGIQRQLPEPPTPTSLAQADDPIAVLTPPAVLEAVLERLGHQMGVWTVADLAALDLANADGVKGIGLLQLDALGALKYRAREVCGYHLHAEPKDTNSPNSATQFGELLVAAHFLTGASSLADLPRINWQVLFGVTNQDVTTSLREIVPESFAFFDVPRVVRTALNLLDDREREILVRTLMAPSAERDTLESVGEELSLTRERVRQIRMRALRAFETTTSSVLGRIAPWLIHLAGQASREVSLADRWSRLLVHETNNEIRKICISAMQRACGYSVGVKGWAFTDSAVSGLRGTRTRLLEAGWKRGIVPEEVIVDALADYISFDDEREAFLTEVVGLFKFKGHWVVNDSARTRVRAALAILGGPATKEELGELTGLEPLRVGSYLSAVGGICRADRERWAYEEWVDDPYDGIVGEILQRIEEDGGSTPVERLLRELPEKFAVSENSVRAYMATPRFVVEGTNVRLATETEISVTHYGSVEDVATAVRLDDGTWATRLVVEERFFEGYSAGLPAPIVRAAGLNPGDSLVVDVEGTPNTVTLIWRIENITRLVDLGRLAPVLTYLCVSPGDELIVAPGRQRVRIFRSEEAPIDRQPRPSDTQRVVVESVLDELFRR